MGGIDDRLSCSHLKSSVMMVHKKQKKSTVETSEMHRGMGAGLAAFFLKSTTISTTLGAFRSRFLLHRGTRW